MSRIFIYIIILFPLFASWNTSIKAQRNIEFYEPDFSKEYMLNKFLYHTYFEYAEHFYPPPYHYLAFFSPYVKENELKKIIKKHKQQYPKEKIDYKQKEVHEFDKDGFLIHSVWKSKWDYKSKWPNSIIEKFYTYDDTRRIITVIGYKAHNALINFNDTYSIWTYYYNEDKILDSVIQTRKKDVRDTEIGVPQKFRFHYRSDKILSSIEHLTKNTVYGFLIDTIPFNSDALWDIRIKEGYVLGDKWGLYTFHSFSKIPDVIDDLDSFIHQKSNDNEDMYVVRSGRRLYYIFIRDNKHFMILKHVDDKPSLFNNESKEQPPYIPPKVSFKYADDFPRFELLYYEFNQDENFLRKLDYTSINRNGRHKNVRHYNTTFFNYGFLNNKNEMILYKDESNIEHKITERKIRKRIRNKKLIMKNYGL